MLNDGFWSGKMAAGDFGVLEKMLAFVRTLVPAKKVKADDAKTERQQAYVKETLTRALQEVKAAKRGEIKMMTEEEFLNGVTQMVP